VITREGLRDEITLRVELRADATDERWDDVAQSLQTELAHAHEGLSFRIERAAGGELPRFELKARRTVDKRDAPLQARS
jgi:phenylacetate-coenzyme A ligase PaaK-like adenylate-forming protein